MTRSFCSFLLMAAMAHGQTARRKLVLEIIWNAQQFSGWQCSYGTHDRIYPEHCHRMEPTPPDISHIGVGYVQGTYLITPKSVSVTVLHGQTGKDAR